MPTTPYDQLETVANMARVRVNDAIVSIGGDILTDIQPFSGQMVNNAWRRMQEYLSDKGVASLDRETPLPSVPACTAADQGTRVYFNYITYYDGTSTQTAPVLPQDLIVPLELFERVHGVTTNYVPMDREYNALPTSPRQPLNRLFQWRQETIYMPGATGLTDILMRYAGYLADFFVGLQDTLSGNINNSTTTIPVTSGLTIVNGTYIQIDSELMLVTAGGGTTSLTATRAQLGTAAAAHTSGANVFVNFRNIPVPLMRCANSLAWFLAGEVARPRADLDAGWFDQQGMAAAEQVWNRDYRQDRALYKGSELGKQPDQNSALKGPDGSRGPQRDNT
jgi:hypothetical protein